MPKFLSKSLEDSCKLNDSTISHCSLLVVYRCKGDVTPVLRQLHWLPVQRRVEFKTCMSGTPVDYVNSADVQYLSADIQLVSEHGRRHLRSSSYRSSLAVPRTRTTLGDRSFAVAGPRVWDSLPATTRQITSYEQSRQHLKTHLFTA